MGSKVNSAVPPVPAATPDSTQRIASKSRLGTFAGIGSVIALGAGAAAAYLIGPEKVISAVNTFFDNQIHRLPSLSGVPYLSQIAGYGTLAALGTAAAGTGAAIGGSVGKLSAHKASLNDVKARLGVAGSDLNFGQMHRVANIAVNGGIFKARTTAVEFKDDASRIRNLNRELTNTEFSLSSNAHNTSKARGVEDRFFDLEGARLANNARSTTQFLSALDSVRSAVNAEVKATDKYTYHKGDSSTSINRREYILGGIMGFAYERGIAGNYLTAAVAERAELAKTNPKQAEAAFRKAIQKGIDAGILAPSVDGRAYEGMVDAAAVASKASSGKNPDAVINSIFDSLKDTGMIDGNLRARFIRDVRAKMTNPSAPVGNPIQQTVGDSPIERLVKRSGMSASSENGSASSKAEGILDGPAVESKSQMKARLAAEEQARADAEVNFYSDVLASFDPRQKELADLYAKLIQLLTEKSIPLDQIMDMGPSRLRGAIAMRHKQGFDLFDRYEANDADIAATRERIAVLTDALLADQVARPESFSRASKAQKKAAEALEKQVKAEDHRIAGLKKKAEAVDAKIHKVEVTLDMDEGKTTSFLFPANEPELSVPETPKQPGFFEKLFAKKKVEEAPQAEGIVEEAVLPAVQEELLDEPAIGEIAVPQAQNGDDALPDPVVQAKPKWKLWG